MSILKVDTIQKADGSGSLSVPAESGTVVTTASPSLGRRNLIINGAMQVWQRGTSASATDDYASADRWRIARGTLSQQTFTAGSELGQNRNYANFDFSSATFAYALQLIEDVSTVAGKTITVSFYIKSDTLTNVYFRAYSGYGSGGSTTTTDKNFEATSITSSWQRITKTFDVTSLSGKTVGAGSYYGVGIYGSLGTALTGDFDIWGFQVELGSVATPFEHRSYGEELALCQRYYQRFNQNASNYIRIGVAVGTGSNAGYMMVSLPSVMRATPTLTSTGLSSSIRFLGGGGSNSVTALTVDRYGSNNNLSVNFTTAAGISAGTAGLIDTGGTTSSDMYLDAEL